jgi:hypothetical protein
MKGDYLRAVLGLLPPIAALLAALVLAGALR